jgi:hypothetical protein
MTQVGRAREKGETVGFMKILADAKTKILDVMYANAPYTVIQRAIHPTVSELIPTMFSELKPLE